MIPTELITMGVTAGMTAYVRSKSASAKYQHDMMRTAIQSLAAKTDIDIKAMNAAAQRTSGDGISSVFRALIVVSLMIVFIFPTVSPLFLDSSVPVYITYYEEGRKVLGIFGQLADKIKFIRLEEGVVILPEFKHMMAAVMGFFFGAASTRR